jgi:predicted metal-dependent phosphoesterase TrpH
MIDLHVHTTASDGVHSPREVLGLALERGLTVLGITDHDTAAGVRQALRDGVPEGLELVAGIEVTAECGGRELHVLGYFIDPDHPRILAFEQRRRDLRRWRLERMVAQLRDAGMDITLDEVFAQGGGEGAPGRPHVARVLVAKGYAASMRDCFDRLLLPGGPGYVGYERPSVREAAEIIDAAGGVAVVAHPALDDLDAMLDAMMADGLVGLEVYHSAHTPEDTARYERFARARGLVQTGGSDFHGVGLEEGASIGSVTCPHECFEELRVRAAAAAAATESGDRVNTEANGP